jgi:hypothetical protein
MSPAAPPVQPGPFSLSTPPLLSALAGARSVLIAGAGGGFDVYAGLPLAALDLPVKLVTCLGFGIDAFDGVNHVQVLENLAALDRDGGYLGALSIPGASREAVLYRDAVADAPLGRRQVISRIAAYRDDVSTRIPRAFPH